jgi:hypothetical protein
MGFVGFLVSINFAIQAFNINENRKVKLAAEHKKKKWNAFLEWVKFNRENINYRIKAKFDQTRGEFNKNTTRLETVSE